MNTNTALARHARDTRLYLFLGLANWFIFLDHIPNNLVNSLTLRNFGFSGAAELFVFIIGYNAALAYAPIMLERGSIVGATRLLRRAWQLYAAFIVLFAIYAVSIGDVATRYAAPDIIYEFNVAGLLEDPVRTVAHGLLLQSRAANLDLLQLFVVLIAGFPLVLWLMLRAPDFTLAASFALYVAARQFEWTLSTFPDGSWFFNPFCWQLLFVLGAWCALGGVSRFRARFRKPVWAYLGLAYLVFAYAMTLAGHFPALGDMLPMWLHDAFIPNDRVNLAPYRILHFIVLALFATRLIPKRWRRLELADPQAADRMRRAGAGGVLCRRAALPRRTLCSGDGFGLAGTTNPGQPFRYRDHDAGCKLCVVVQTPGWAVSRADPPPCFAGYRLRPAQARFSVKLKPFPLSAAYHVCFGEYSRRSPRCNPNPPTTPL